MSNKQKEEDRSSTTGSNFEPIDTPQQGQELELEESKDNKDMDDVDGKSSCNNDGVSSSYGGGEASIGELEKKLLEEKLKVAEMKAEKAEKKVAMMKTEMEKAEMGSEMAGLKAKLQMMEMEKQMDAAKSGEGKKVAEVLAQEFRAQLQAMLLKTIEEEVPKSLKRMEEDALAANLKKLVEDERLEDWLATGAGQIRNVPLLRIASNQLISFGGWGILDGRLKATKTGSEYACVRAEKPFPVSGAQNQQIGQLLYFFEVTVITKGTSWIIIGLCGANYPFTSTSYTYVGHVSGSFGIQDCGNYHASGKSVAGYGKGSFSKGDAVGCGLLVLPAERRLFFTKNDELWGKPILLGADEAKADLYPAVSARDSGHEVEFNFGADLASKPYKYDLAQLNVVDV